jgi:hypothetical protein
MACADIVPHVGFALSLLLAAQGDALGHEDPPEALVLEEETAHVLRIVSTAIGHVTLLGNPGQSAERVECETIEQSRHAVLGSEIRKFFAVLPATHSLEEISQPVQNFAFASPGETVKQDAEGLRANR